MLSGLSRFLVTVETAKCRTSFIQREGTLCEHGTISFGLEGLYFLGVMSSRIDVAWALDERAAEEKRGLIRWLRPDFQNKGGSNVVQQEIAVADDDEEAAAEHAEKRPRWSRGAAQKSRSSRAEKPG